MWQELHSACDSALLFLVSHSGLNLSSRPGALNMMVLVFDSSPCQLVLLFRVLLTDFLPTANNIPRCCLPILPLLHLLSDGEG